MACGAHGSFKKSSEMDGVCFADKSGLGCKMGLDSLRDTPFKVHGTLVIRTFINLNEYCGIDAAVD